MTGKPPCYWCKQEGRALAATVCEGRDGEVVAGLCEGCYALPRARTGLVLPFTRGEFGPAATLRWSREMPDGSTRAFEATRGIPGLTQSLRDIGWFLGTPSRDSPDTP